MQETNMEMQSFLPKTSLDSDTATVAGPRVAGTSSSGRTTRTRVEFWTPRKNPGFILIKRNWTYFVFGEHVTVQQAAEHAATNYPSTDEVPVFNDVCVFLREAGQSITVTDVHVNFHSFFRETDTMIVSNSPRILELHWKDQMRFMCVFLSILFGVLVFVFAMIIINDK